MSNPAAIIDYGMGNLQAVKQACDAVGLPSVITSDPGTLETSRALVLPGVGAFGDAMEALRRQDLVDAVRAYAKSDKPVLGVCLGLQLLMTRSEEFGDHEGLDIVRGKVVRLSGRSMQKRVKVPHVGWSRVLPAGAGWDGSPMRGVRPGEFMYFVHSYRVLPLNPEDAIAKTHHGDEEFPSAIRRGRVFGCQFHPERSGPMGLRVYEAVAKASVETTP